MEDLLKFRGVEDLSRGSHLQNGLLKEDDLVSIMAQGGEIVGGEEDGEIIFLPDLVQHIQQQMLSPTSTPDRGSSKMRICGMGSRARASSTRWSSPPERVPMRF